MKISNFARLSASLIAISTAAPAWAQDAAEADTGEIIVTATRENTRLSKTPIAMSAVSGDSLVSEGITDPTSWGIGPQHFD